MRQSMSQASRPFRTAAAAFLLAAGLCVPAAPAAASSDGTDDWYASDSDHPLRVAYYFISPVGSLLEWTVMRPLAAVGNVVAPYEHIDRKPDTRCSRERPSRTCSAVVR